VNLISGMVIAEVAIRQKENYGNDVPSSFKEFADASLNNPLASNLIAGISLFTNACVLSFDLVRAGDVTSCMLGGVSPIISTLGFAGLLVTCVSSLSGQVLARLASAAVTALFLSFFGILLPGLANVLDPVSTFLTPGLSDSGISEAAPIILMTLVYQNIVPSVTKILDYDRTKTLAAIGLGSFLPLFLYVAWCFACLGGGAAASGGLLLTVFSLAAVSGSSLGCVLSLSEEVESFLAKDKSVGDSTLNIWSVLAGVGVPVAAALVFAGSDDFTVALKLAGSYGSPLLYGAIPAFMAWKQLQESNSNSSQCEGEPSGRFDLIPGGSGTLAILGGASAVMVLQEFVTDFSGAVFS
jgi:tyrosine-specific transport protein